jgi:hypothetical protein
MSLEKKPVECLHSFRIVRENDFFMIVEKGAEHNEPVQNVALFHILDGFFDTKHILAETPSTSPIGDAALRNDKLVAAGKESYAGGFFFVEIGVMGARPRGKSKKVNASYAAVEPEVLYHRKNIPQHRPIMLFTDEKETSFQSRGDG